MQRAAAGETFLITRRGKPYVGLGPAADQSTERRLVGLLGR